MKNLWATNNYDGEASYNMWYFKYPVWSLYNKMFIVL